MEIEFAWKESGFGIQVPSENFFEQSSSFVSYMKIL
jgi:hypothetical protein